MRKIVLIILGVLMAAYSPKELAMALAQAQAQPPDGPSRSLFQDPRTEELYRLMQPNPQGWPADDAPVSPRVRSHETDDDVKYRPSRRTKKQD